MSHCGEPVCLSRRSLAVPVAILALSCLPSCAVDLSTPGGIAWPTRLEVRASVQDAIAGPVTLGWEARKLRDADLPDGMARVDGEDDSPAGSFSLPSPPTPPFTRAFPVSARLDPGRWRVETRITGAQRTVRTVCDIEIPRSDSWDQPLIVDLTASRNGCTTTGEGLVAQSRVTDFSEYPTGATPFDWASADANGAPDPTWTVETGMGLGGRQLQRSATASGVSGIGWTDIVQQDVEVLAKLRTPNVDPVVSSPMLELRIDVADVQAYYATLRNGQELLIGRLQAGQVQDLTLNPVGFAYLPDSWLWLRFSVRGNDLAARVWPDGASPTGAAASFISVSDPTIPDPGFTGFIVLDDAADQIDFVSVGMAGSVAVPPLAMTCPAEEAPYFMCP